MREIKFRVWDGSQMVHDVTVGRFGAFYVNPGSMGDGLDAKDAASLTPFNTRYPGSAPVMQYTGLKDADGKEIYEGDILRYSLQYTTYLSVATWEDGGFVQAETEGMIIEPFILGLDHSRVIGNIYEHPHLVNA